MHGGDLNPTPLSGLRIFTSAVSASLAIQANWNVSNTDLRDAVTTRGKEV